MVPVGGPQKEEIREPCDFSELHDNLTRKIFDALIRGGAREMRGEIHTAMYMVLDWDHNKKAWEKQNKRHKRHKRQK